MGQELESHETLLGHALDGFPIYGHLEDDSILDVCNGMYKDGKYQYHVKTLDQVNDSLEYCNEDDPNVNSWNYILGCYSGSVDDTNVYDSTIYELPDDCVVDDLQASEEGTATTSTIATTTSIESTTINKTEQDNNNIPFVYTEDEKDTTLKRPNIIIMQPDDLPFFDIWNPPPNNPTTPDQSINMPNSGLPNIESLRLNGLQMLQAYTTSPMCGTSRFSTITSRYPSRAISNDDDVAADLKEVVIPKTKLQGEDCTSDNIAVSFRDNGYRTAMIGKWHLSRINKNTYTYDSAVDIVKACGFDTVEGLYVENLASENDFNNFSDGTFSHNMEWITSEAIKIIKEDSEEPFFLYFNPTVPHSSNSVESALRDFSCRNTATGTFSSDPIIPGMTDDGDCESYRETVFDRSETNDDLGAIWIDDSVGSILMALEDKGILNDTIFVFQADHGVDPKAALYEGGIRIPQFIHYPNKISAGTKFDSPISVMDTSATLLEYAGITPSYDIDGSSWKEVIAGNDSETKWKDRCLFYEMGTDRSTRCGCYKYLEIFDQTDSTTFRRGNAKGLSNDERNLFNLCGQSEDEYVSDIRGNNMEAINLNEGESITASQLEAIQQCHVDRTMDGSYDSCQLDDQNDTNNDTNSPTKRPTFAPISMPPSNRPISSAPQMMTYNPTKQPIISPVSNSPTLLNSIGSSASTSSPSEPPKASLSPATETPSMKPSIPTTNLNNSKNPSQSPDTSPPSLAPDSPSPIEQSLSKIPSSSPINEASSVTSVVVETTYSTPSTEVPIDLNDTPINNDTDDTTSIPPTQSPVRAVETFSPTDDTDTTTMSPNSISSSSSLRSLSILSNNMMILTTIMYSLYSV